MNGRHAMELDLALGDVRVELDERGVVAPVTVVLRASTPPIVEAIDVAGSFRMPAEIGGERGEVLAGALDDEPRRAAVAHQAQRVAWNAESQLELRAHRHPLDEGRECLREKRVVLVAAVVAHGLAEEARGDAEADLFFGHRVE